MDERAAKSYLVAVGINEFDHYRTLSCCTNDATTFAEAIEKQVPDAHCELLIGKDTGAGKSQATKEEIVARLHEVAELHASPDDTVFFYFAGHGVTSEGQDRLICADSTPDDPESAVSTDDVIAAISKSGAGTGVLVIDACRIQVARSAGLFGERTAELARRRGVIAFFGCSPGEVCQELSLLGGGHGLFTYSFLKAMNEMKRLVPLEIDRAVEEEVRTLCDKHKLARQRPYTTVAPIQKTVVDLLTGHVVELDRSTSRHCLLIVGPCNAGKTSLGQILAREIGFVHLEMSTFAWQRYEDASDYTGSIQDYMEDVVWRNDDTDIIAQDLVSSLGAIGKDIVVCGARRLEEIETLRKQGWEMTEIFLFANAAVRFQRHRAAAPHTRMDLSYRDFIKRDMQEYSWGLAKAATLPGVRIVSNEGRIEDLGKYVKDRLLTKSKVQ